MKQIRLFLLTAAGMFLMFGCSLDTLHKLVKSPDATIERDVQGHEQIYTVQAILRYAQWNPRSEAYSAYDMSEVKHPIPVFQEIEISKDDEGNMMITSERKHFDVLKGKDIFYGLELKYYNLNGKLINHQFSHYSVDEKTGQVTDNSTLNVHQHLFTIQNYALGGGALVYPMTLDSLYYDRYLFMMDEFGNRKLCTKVSPSGIYAPEQGYVSGQMRYDRELAMKAIENTIGEKAIKPYEDPKTKKVYRLYSTIDTQILNGRVPEIFEYWYRDTDPVEEWLGTILSDRDDLGRFRPNPVGFLRQKRSLDHGAPLDALGFKGILRFNKSNIAFQMRISVCHILTNYGKYDKVGAPNRLHPHNDLPNSWNSFDMDYPISFRVLADTDGDHAKCIEDIRKYYPQADPVTLEKMIWGTEYFTRRTPKVMM